MTNAMKAKALMGGENQKTLPGGGFHGGENQKTLPGGGFHSGK